MIISLIKKLLTYLKKTVIQVEGRGSKDINMVWPEQALRSTHQQHLPRLSSRNYWKVEHWKWPVIKKLAQKTSLNRLNIICPVGAQCVFKVVLPASLNGHSRIWRSELPSVSAVSVGDVEPFKMHFAWNTNSRPLKGLSSTGGTGCSFFSTSSALHNMSGTVYWPWPSVSQTASGKLIFWSQLFVKQGPISNKGFAGQNLAWAPGEKAHLDSGNGITVNMCTPAEIELPFDQNDIDIEYFRIWQTAGAGHGRTPGPCYPELVFCKYQPKRHYLTIRSEAAAGTTRVTYTSLDAMITNLKYIVDLYVPGEATDFLNTSRETY